MALSGVLYEVLDPSKQALGEECPCTPHTHMHPSNIELNCPTPRLMKVNFILVAVTS